MCEHNWLHTTYSRVCSTCGVEIKQLHVDTYNRFSAPILRGYNRCARFKLKVDKLLCFHSGPQFKDKIWNLLKQQQHIMSCPKDIRSVLRTLNTKNKHYDCCRIFSRTFTDFRVSLKYNVHDLRTKLVSKFEDIFMSWCSSPYDHFFSYDFLLREFRIF